RLVVTALGRDLAEPVVAVRQARSLPELFGRDDARLFAAAVAHRASRAAARRHDAGRDDHHERRTHGRRSLARSRDRAKAACARAPRPTRSGSLTFRPAYLELTLAEIRRRAEQAVAALARCEICPRNCRVNRLVDEARV